MTRMAPNYDQHPFVALDERADECVAGWEAVVGVLADAIRAGRRRVVIECYCGVFEEEVTAAVARGLPGARVLRSADAFRNRDEIARLVAPFDGGDDPLFGWLCGLRMEDFLDEGRVAAMRRAIDAAGEPVVLVGCGASVVHAGDLLVHADLPRWEGQLRMRRGECENLGAGNRGERWTLQYKRAFFIDWRVCDRLKRELIGRADFVLDTTRPGEPRLVTGAAVRAAYQATLARPFRVKPFFDPAPWGGQWMKRAFGLPDNGANYGWCFDCVPEENSIVFRFGPTEVELPSVNLVFANPVALLGERVHARFGDEFPIRFDLLDSVGGGHLSFQVHPLTEYIQHRFGMHYTQDESYYVLDAAAGAEVFLGLREGTDVAAMVADLERAQAGGAPFDDRRYVCRWPARRHDHFLIPAGTCHCSGAGTMVLEISATPYLFTFKLWDWGRLGLDGLPRPINLRHGSRNIVPGRTESWVRRELVNRVEEIARGEGWREERTGLHEREFIETRRHWFTGTAPHDTAGGVNVLNLVEGREAVVESPGGAFAPFVVHHAETFIVPAAVGRYTIRPHGAAAATGCATIKASVRV